MNGSSRYDERELRRILQQVEALGPRLNKIAKNLHMTVGQVAGVKRRNRTAWDEAVNLHRRTAPVAGNGRAGATASTASAEEVKITGRGDDVMELSSFSARIKTVEELIARTEIDTSKWIVAEFEATSNEMPVKDADGEVQLIPYFRLWAKVKAKPAMAVQDAVEVMIQETLKPVRRERVRALRPKGDVLQKIVIADPHIAKYAWHKTTGQGNWDVDLSVDAIINCAFELIEEGEEYRLPVARRTIALLGDYWHFDTPSGTTTGGTPLDRDSRLQNMIERGTDALLRVIDRSAQSANTDVIIVPGNHDVTLSWATQRILQAHYRNDDRVTIDGGFATRKYMRWGKTLLGFTHGDKARKKLPGLMTIEAKQDWALADYREFHTGHFHNVEEKVANIDGVLVRTAPALCPPDDWHAEHGFLGALRAMESFLYHADGGVVASFTSSPDYLVRP